MKSIRSEVWNPFVSAERASSLGRFPREPVETVDGGRTGRVLSAEREVLDSYDPLAGPVDLMNSAKSRVESEGETRASRACPILLDLDVDDALVKRVVSGMCLGDSIDLVWETGLISPVAFEETEAWGRCLSSPGGAVVFKNAARSETPPAVSDRGTARLDDSGNVISLTLRGVRV